VPRFFGLTPDDKTVYLEHIFTLMYYVGFSYEAAMRLPVWQRIWFIERVVEEFKKSNGEQSRAAHTNTPDMRSLSGKARSHVPANLRRFT